MFYFVAPSSLSTQAQKKPSGDQSNHWHGVLRFQLTAKWWFEAIESVKMSCRIFQSDEIQTSFNLISSLYHLISLSFCLSVPFRRSPQAQQHWLLRSSNWIRRLCDKSAQMSPRLAQLWCHSRIEGADHVHLNLDLFSLSSKADCMP